MNTSRGNLVIFGGANGIGFSCAEISAEYGWRPIIVDRDERSGIAAAERLGTAFYRVDLLEVDELDSLRSRIEADWGCAAGLINSAGISQPVCSPESLPQDTWDAVQKIHLRGTYLSCKAFGTEMARRGQGAIVNIASIAGMRSVPLHSYGPAKAAMIALSSGLAVEWGGSGVRVNTVSPGFTRTERVERRIALGERDGAAYSRSALGRMVEPAEVARACLFLLSDHASGIAGINLPVDAGWLAAPSWDAFGGLPSARRAAV